MSGQMSSEVQVRVTKGYLERLAQRAQRLRKLYAEREWVQMAQEGNHLRTTAPTFGFPELSNLALELEKALNAPENSKARVTPEVRRHTEALLVAIDDILIADTFGRG